MKQFDLQGNEYDCTIEIPLKKATYEDIQALNINLQTQLFVREKEIERLNNIIKEAKEFIYENAYDSERQNCIDDLWGEIPKLLEILKKENK